MSIWKGLQSIFGFEGVGNSALKIVDKIAGTDWTAKEKAQFTLDYAEKTKYQSPTRRFIALVYVLEWVLMVNTWAVATIYGRMAKSPDSLLLATDISTFMSGNINIAMNGILAFYFLIGMKK